MTERQEILELDLSIRRSPESVRLWWTDFQDDDYHAIDPAEQPFRVLTTKRTPGGRELQTYWRFPDGSIRDHREIMELKSDGTWTFEIPSHPLGFRIFDEFSASATKDGRGTNLHIRSTIEALSPSASAQLETQKERMVQLWRKMVPICERDAP